MYTSCALPRCHASCVTAWRGPTRALRRCPAHGAPCNTREAWRRQQLRLPTWLGAPRLRHEVTLAAAAMPPMGRPGRQTGNTPSANANHKGGGSCHTGHPAGTTHAHDDTDGRTRAAQFPPTPAAWAVLADSDLDEHPTEAHAICRTPQLVRGVAARGRATLPHTAMRYNTVMGDTRGGPRRQARGREHQQPAAHTLPATHTRAHTHTIVVMWRRTTTGPSWRASNPPTVVRLPQQVR